MMIKQSLLSLGHDNNWPKLISTSSRLLALWFHRLGMSRIWGCWLDTNMKFDTHISKCCKAAFFHLYNIRRIRKFLSHDTVQILVNAFVTSRLDYCNSLLYGLRTKFVNCNVCKILPPDLYATLVDLTTSHLLYLNSTGCPLNSGLTLKYYLLHINQSMV